MPYLIGGDFDDHAREVNITRQIEQDADVLKQTPQQQFGYQPDGLTSLLRARFEVGRVYFRLEQHENELPGLIRGNWVSNRFKELIEELEPDKHVFVERDLRLQDGKTEWAEKYWYWYCNNIVTAIVPDIGDNDTDRSYRIGWNADKKCLCDHEGNPFGPMSSPQALMRIVLNRRAIEGQQAWRDGGFYHPHDVAFIFVSDDFFDRLKAVKAEAGFRFKRVEVSDLQPAGEGEAGEITWK